MDEKRRKVSHNESLSKSHVKKKKEKVKNDFFLSQLGDEELVQPIISNEKNKQGRRETLKESLITLQQLNRNAHTTHTSP